MKYDVKLFALGKWSSPDGHSERGACADWQPAHVHSSLLPGKGDSCLQMASLSVSLCEELLALQGVLEHCGNVHFCSVGEKPWGGPGDLFKSVFGEAYPGGQLMFGKGMAPFGRVQTGTTALPALPCSTPGNGCICVHE